MRLRQPALRRVSWGNPFNHRCPKQALLRLGDALRILATVCSGFPAGSQTMMSWHSLPYRRWGLARRRPQAFRRAPLRALKGTIRDSLTFEL